MFYRIYKRLVDNHQSYPVSGIAGLLIIVLIVSFLLTVPVLANQEQSKQAGQDQSTSSDRSAGSDQKAGQSHTTEAEAEVVPGGGAAISGQIEGLGYATKLYDATNGLPTSDANTILFASDGFIWIGSYSGLIRYDGTAFERQDSSNGVTNVNTLFEDHKGRLWVGTNDNGLVMLDKGTSKHWDYKEGISSSSIRTIAEDDQGNILLGTTQGVDYIDKKGSLHSLDEPQLQDVYVMYMTADSSGRIYGTTRDGAVFCIKDKKVTAHYNGRDLGIGDITAVFPSIDEPGQVYLGTSSGMLCIGSMDDHLTSLEKTDINSVFMKTIDARADRDDESSKADMDEASQEKKKITRISYASGRIWLLCESRIGYLDEDRQFHPLSNLPMDNSIVSMTEDYEGNLWFASDRQGVMKIVANKFANVTEAAGLPPGVVNTTCLHDGRLYIGTDAGLQIVENGNKIENDPLQKAIGETRIRCIMEDPDKNLWISAYDNDKGLVCLQNDGNLTSYTEDDGLLDNEVRSTVMASDGSVLVASNGGLNVIKDGKIVRSLGTESGLSNTVILTVAEGDKGEYYLGTDGGGIYVADGNNLTRIGRDDGLTSDIILRIKKDERSGVHWIITSNSIEYMKDGKIKQVDAFPYTNNYDLFMDHNDNAWILSSYGVFVARVQDLLDDKKDLDYEAYDMHSGLLSIPTTNSYSALSQDGTLYIAGRSGVCSVNIDNYFGQTHKIMLSVPYLESRGVRYYPDKNNEVTLPSSANPVRIYGYALTYSMQNPELEYFMEGYDKESTLVSKEKLGPVKYSNMGGGSYTYELAVINNSTGEKQQTMKLSIIKEKAFYEQIWFYLIVLFVLILLVVALVRLYLNYKMKVYKKKEEEQRTLIREMVTAFSKTIDLKDKYTKGHSGRVAVYTKMLARELGCDEETVEKYYNIALLHDIGKIGIPPEVLNKPGKLTDEEFAIIKSHSSLGYEALKDISIMPELAIGAGYHHERPDGCGYPKGLKGDEIPYVARIIAVADTFDAMYSNRPYRKRMNFDKAVSIIKEVSGVQLDPEVVDAFLRLVEKGQFRAPNDTGGGSMEDIDNIHKKYKKKE